MNQDQIAALKAAESELVWMANDHTGECAFERLEGRGYYIRMTHPSVILSLIAQLEDAKSELCRKEAVVAVGSTTFRFFYIKMVK